MSFYTSLSGLKAAQTDLSVVSNNVANVGSIGFKKSRAEFGDIISSSPLQSSAVAGSGTRLKSISQLFTQGGFATSERGLDLAISGQGFFVTRQDLDGGQTGFTRNGAFGVDAQRYVTDSKGNYLQALPVDDEGNVTANGMGAAQNLRVPLTGSGIDARATSKLQATVTLPNGASVPAARDKFDRFDPNSYNFATATTVYDDAGNPFQATTYYTRETAPADQDKSVTWAARTFVGDTEINPDPATKDQAAGPFEPLLIKFDAAGVKTEPTAATTYPPVTPTGASAPIAMSVDLGGSPSLGATFSVKGVKQDGLPAGQLRNVSVEPDGLVTATYSNGAVEKLGKVMIADFPNPSGLRALSDATWAPTGNSGDPIIGTAASGGMGAIESGRLEQANVDITEELVALITAQRNFQANAKAIDTANQMTQIAVNLRGS